MSKIQREGNERIIGGTEQACLIVCEREEEVER